MTDGQKKALIDAIIYGAGVLQGDKHIPLKDIYRPINHDKDCDYHVDQYPWECTCGVIPYER